jgi:hypothetical protein
MNGRKWKTAENAEQRSIKYESPFDGGQLMVVTVVSRFITLSSRGIIEATRSIYL